MADFFKAVKNNKLKLFLFLFLLVLYLVPRTIHLGSDISNSDAARWHRRSIRFLEALKNKDFKQTYQHYQPGVTLMWLDSFNIQLNKSWTLLENTGDYVNIHKFTKIMIVSVLFVLFITQLVFLKILFGDKVAFLFGFFVVTETYLIGIDRWVHLTSLETYFSFTAVLAMFAHFKAKRDFLLIISGMLLGFAVLSKLTSLMILPFLCMLIFGKRTKSSLKPLVIFILTFGFVFILFFPALWVDFQSVITKLINSVSGAISGDIRGTYYSGLRSIIYYPVILMFKLSPLTIITLLIALISYIKTRSIKWPVLLFVYELTVLTLSDKKIDRYTIFLFPSVLLIVALYLSQLNSKFLGLFLTIQFLLFMWGFIRYSPVFSAYYSPLFGGEKTALQTGYYENSGEYYAQAAFYLNKLGRNKKVFVPDNYESFSYFNNSEKLRDPGKNVDYIVSGVDFDRKKPVSLDCPTVEKTFGPRGFDVVYIFSCKKEVL